MEEILLNVELREGIGKSKVKDLREEGFIPAVVYGKESEAQSIKIQRSQLLHLLHQHRLENVIISLKVKNKTRPCLIKEIQYHPVHGDITHVDFNEISLTKAVKINIPVVAKGEPVGVKQEGGSLEHILWEVEVECLPTDIPKEIEVDVSQLKIGDSIHVKELPVPPKVKILSDPDATVISVAEPLKEEVAAAPVEGEVAQEPEVIKEKKEAPAEGETPAEEKGKKEK